MAWRQLQDLTSVQREAKGPELLDHPTSPLDSVVPRGGQEFGESVIVRINEMPKDVNLQVLHMGGDLDTGNELHPHPRDLRHRRWETLHGIVIGDGQDGDAGLFRQTDKFGGRKR